jgi:pyridoxamine 5'-phosphate oxidase
MQEDPILLFRNWLLEAKKTELNDPNAMTLATCDRSGLVTARVVLLKDISDGKFVFYTNLGSRKVQQIQENSKVSLCFHWKSLEKQVRVEGEALQIPDDTADAYFSCRPRESQIGAWASKQSQPMKDEIELKKRIEYYENKFKDQDIPRPDFWSGFAVNPQRIEFWTEKPFRLHERCVYMRYNLDTWIVERLYP